MLESLSLSWNAVYSCLVCPRLCSLGARSEGRSPKPELASSSSESSDFCAPGTGRQHLHLALVGLSFASGMLSAMGVLDGQQSHTRPLKGSSRSRGC